MRMNKKLEKAIKYISGYCNKHDKCENCPLQGKDGCVLTEVHPPCDWDNILKNDA